MASTSRESHIYFQMTLKKQGAARQGIRPLSEFTKCVARRKQQTTFGLHENTVDHVDLDLVVSLGGILGFNGLQAPTGSQRYGFRFSSRGRALTSFKQQY
jgi:hypothetical protein